MAKTTTPSGIPKNIPATHVKGTISNDVPKMRNPPPPPSKKS